MSGRGRTGRGGSIFSKFLVVVTSSSSSLEISPFLLFFFLRLGASSSETSAEASPPFTQSIVSSARRTQKGANRKALTFPFARSRSSSAHSSCFSFRSLLTSARSFEVGIPVEKGKNECQQLGLREIILESAPLIIDLNSSSHLISRELGESCDPGVTQEMKFSAKAFRTSFSAASCATSQRRNAFQSVGCGVTN